MAVSGGSFTRTRPRHVPRRTCVACRSSSAKRGLVRVVRSPEGRVEVDPTGRRAGRGAYLCRRRGCWEQALRSPKDPLAHGLRARLSGEERNALWAFAASLPESPPESPMEEAAL